MTRTFATAWMQNDGQATQFLPRRVYVPELRAESVRIAQQKPLDPRVLQVLVRQNAQLPPSPQREKNLQVLAQPGTVIVATGQQVGLFLGPLYTLYKAASAVLAAQKLQEETGVPCVPLFWLQTEDHDFAEIDHCFVPRTGQEPLKIALEFSEPSRVPVAHRRLGASVLPALDELERALTGLPHAGEVLDLLRKFYVPEASMALAFAQVLATLFQDEGLIFLDPRDAELAPVIAPLYRQFLVDAQRISQLLQDRSQQLAQADFPPQVHIRPGSPLLFASPEAVEGPRYRLDPLEIPETWQLVGDPKQRTVTTPELLDWLDREPLRLTSSALSRPLLQDTLLPTVAYVGGPGELGYFAQLQTLYAQFHLPMPLVLHRARFAILDQRTQQLLETLHLSLADLARPREELLRDLAAHMQHADFENPAEILAKLSLDAPLEQLAQQMAKLDPNLQKAVKRTQETVQDAVGKLVDKYAKLLAERDRTTVDRLDRARQWLQPGGGLQPGGVPQERVYGMPGLAARFGLQRLVKAVLAEGQPFTGALQELVL